MEAAGVIGVLRGGEVVCGLWYVDDARVEEVGGADGIREGVGSQRNTDSETMLFLLVGIESGVRRLDSMGGIAVVRIRNLPGSCVRRM